MVPNIGKYRLIAELARGGMGQVYLAITQGPAGFSKLVVVKELRPELRRDAGYVTMFLEEARLAARLIHPNIVQTNEVGSDGERHFLVMEFLDGRSLRRIQQRLGERLPVGAHLHAVAEALSGLHHAHEMLDFDGRPLGVVHRDMSPLNVFVTFSGHTKVIDFGVAKARDSSLETRVGVLKGRVAYMAPEQATGAKVDRRADIYSVGVMLWEAAAQRRLWQGLTDVEILGRLLQDRPPSLRSVCPDVPEDLDAVCARAMAPRREDRYPTAVELLHDLEAHLARRADTMNTRALGSLLAREFADEQRQTRALVEETLARLLAEDAADGPPSSLTPIARSWPAAPKSGEWSQAAPTQFFAPEGAPLPLPPEHSVPHHSLLVSRRQSVSISRAAPPTAATLSRLDALRRQSFWKRPATIWPASALGLVAAALVAHGLHAGKAGDQSSAAESRPGAGLLGSTEASTRTTTAWSQASAEAGAAQAAPASVVPESLELTVVMTPASARISLDGAPVEGNPFRARLPRDGQLHRVEGVAPGYEPKLEWVTFAHDTSVDVTLDRQVVDAPPPPTPGPAAGLAGATLRRPRRALPPRPEPPAASASASPAPRAFFPDVSPGGGHIPVRPIATEDPYSGF